MSVTHENIRIAIEMAKEFGIKRLLLFGSALTNPEDANDLDIGISGIKETEFLKFAGLLENRLNKQVDVIPLDGDNDFIRYIIKNGKFIYEAG